MDSGSGSLQSSSGGDEEYDSHQQQQPQLFPPPPLFFNNNIPPPPPPPLSSHHIISSSSAGSSSIPQQHSPFHLSHHNYQTQFHPNFYDLPSNYNLQTPNFNPDSSNSFLNLDVVRPNSTSLRSEPTTDFKNLPPSDGSIPIRSTPNPNPNPSSSGVLHPKVTTKKRTRASRRAPTTVLTTDTTNFRAMVQEFTGIPSPPFTAGGSSYSRRFDLFGSVRSTSTTITTNLEASGSSGLLYPSRSKVQVFPSLNNENVGLENQNVSNLQQQQQAQAGIFSFQSLSEGTTHIHGSSTTTSQQLLSALQNEETWRSNGGGTAAATHSNNNNNNAGNCKLNNFTGGSSSSSNNLHRDKEILLGSLVSATTTRGESTVDSWICPSD